MLFVIMGTPVTANFREVINRRAQWKYPDGIRLVAEYWPQGGEYNVITIAEADSVAPIMAALVAWQDMFQFTATPAVTAEEGLRLAQQMMKR